jgi:hypothetical protein
MKSARRQPLRFWLEELEGRVVPSTVQSTNWSGYAIQAKAGAVTYVAGSWTVPSVGAVRGASAAWVGIDGWRSTTVEQIGTESDYVNGQAQYYAWYEMYPSVSRIITTTPTSNTPMPVSPGDSITASVQYAAATGFTLTINDSSWAQPFSIAISKHAAAAQRSSAEWVVEAPSTYHILHLADFSPVTFTNTQATINSVNGGINTVWAHAKLEQVDMFSARGAQLDTTSSLNSTGTSFTVTREATSAGPAVTTRQTHGGTTHSPNAPLTVVAVLVAPPLMPPMSVATTVSIPSQPVVAPVQITTSAAPTTTGLTSSLAPFEGSVGSDDQPMPMDGPGQLRDLPAPRPGGAPVVPNDPAGPSDADRAPAALPAPAVLEHPADSPVWLGALVGDTARPVVEDRASPSGDDPGPGGTSVEVAGVVLTLAFSGSCGLGLEDRTTRRRRPTLSD